MDEEKHLIRSLIYDFVDFLFEDIMTLKDRNYYLSRDLGNAYRIRSNFQEGLESLRIAVIHLEEYAICRKIPISLVFSDDEKEAVRMSNYTKATVRYLLQWEEVELARKLVMLLPLGLIPTYKVFSYTKNP